MNEKQIQHRELMRSSGQYFHRVDPDLLSKAPPSQILYSSEHTEVPGPTAPGSAEETGGAPGSSSNYTDRN